MTLQGCPGLSRDGQALSSGTEKSWDVSQTGKRHGLGWGGSLPLKAVCRLQSRHNEAFTYHIKVYSLVMQDVLWVQQLSRATPFLWMQHALILWFHHVTVSFNLISARHLTPSSSVPGVSELSLRLNFPKNKLPSLVILGKTKLPEWMEEAGRYGFFCCLLKTLEKNQFLIISTLKFPTEMVIGEERKGPMKDST